MNGGGRSRCRRRFTPQRPSRLGHSRLDDERAAILLHQSREEDREEVEAVRRQPQVSDGGEESPNGHRPILPNILRSEKVAPLLFDFVSLVATLRAGPGARRESSRRDAIE